MAVSKLEVLSKDEKQREEYLARQKAIRDEKEKANYAHNLAKEKFERGIEEGIRKNKIETAKNLLAMGMSVEKISDATGLTKEEIEKLK